MEPGQAKEETEIPRVQELDRSARTVKEWLAQIEQQNPPGKSQVGEVIQVTSVKANPTAKGVEVILQSDKGQQLQVVNRTVGNNFITDIPNAQLRLPNGDTFTFRSEKPIAGVTEITVTNFDAQTIRVSVTGETGVPTVELFDSPDEGLIFSVASGAASSAQNPTTPTDLPRGGETQQTQSEQPSTEGDEPIELVVTGEQDGYTVPEASTATLTDTPLRDIPQSIQVIPQQVIKDQGITRIVDAVRNVSGTQIGGGYGNLFGEVRIRGFGGGQLVDGFNGLLPANGANIEQVEVLKGPASVLFGEGDPGGLVNYVTKKPLSNPYYYASFTAGSYDYYNPAIDLSGPLTTDKRLLYRLNVSYENSGSYRDYIENDILYISPVISYKISDATTLDFAYEYLDSKQGFDRGFKPEAIYLTLPRNRNLAQPDDFQNNESHRLALTLSQQFGENWRLRSRFSAQFGEGGEKVTQTTGDLLEDGRTLTREQFGDGPNYSQSYALQTNLIGKFNTGAIAHQLLLGVDWKRNTSNYSNSYYIDFPSIDIFQPNYDVLLPERVYTRGNSANNGIGIYLQDQVTLLPNLKLVLGGRYDYFDNSSENFSITDEPQKSSANSQAFSPRVGIVYQPIEPISLYASYNRSFAGNLGTLKAGRIQIEPSYSTQYEAGIRAELLDKRLSVNLAVYDITKTNVPTTDSNNDQFSIAIGEVKSRGIELDVAGEILPGWKVIASGFLNDAYVSKGYAGLPEGRHLTNAPYHGASLWTTYEFQKGNLQGLQLGAGLFFKGDRTANIDDPFILPSYVTTEALIGYKRDNWRAALNFKNIFNVRYYESNDYLTFPQAPFTVQGTISFEF